MKKIILIAILPITIMMAGSFVMTEGNPLIKADTVSTSPTKPSSPTDTTSSDWTPKPLPTQKFNVLDYGLTGNGVTDDSSALRTLAKNTNVTNWYFPAGKTFRLKAITVPEHIKAVFGGGTLKTITDSESYPKGPINQTTDHTGYVIDGLTFVDDGGGSGYNGTYGFVSISEHGRKENIEIRNCTFDGSSSISTQFSRNAMTVRGNPDFGYTRNTWIHNNLFVNINGAGMEILQRGTIDPEGELKSNYNTRVNSNIFNGRGWCAISVSQARSKTTIENNTFDNWKWDIELNQSKNITVQYNKSTNNREEFISIGGAGWHTPEYDDNQAPNINWVHHNHFDTDTSVIVMYSGTSTHVYANYIRGGFFISNRGGHGNTGNMYNNTIVKDSDISTKIGTAGFILGMTVHSGGGTFANDSVPFYDNDVYFTGTKTRYALNLYSSSGPKVSITGNTIRRGNTTDCIPSQSSSTISDNTCAKNYIGSIPTSRPGAGLSDPRNIGPQR